MAKKQEKFTFSSVIDRMGNAGVSIEWGKMSGTLEAPAARAFAQGILVASIDAETDAAFLHTLVAGGMSPKDAEQHVGRLQHVRNERRRAAVAEVENPQDEPTNEEAEEQGPVAESRGISRLWRPGTGN